MHTATRSAANAAAAMKELHDKNANVGVGACLHTCRTAWGLPGGSPDAATQWHSIPPEHRRNGPAPLGAPVFWTGGSHGYGHIAISDGLGSVWSTDLPTSSRVGHIPVDVVVKSWSNHQLVGWSTMLEGYLLPVSESGKA